jgi:integrase/recombinase XerD
VRESSLNEKISAHWLRHAHARHAIEAGAPIHVVRDTLRHSSIAVTNAYLESFPDQSSADYLNLGNIKSSKAQG